MPFFDLTSFYRLGQKSLRKLRWVLSERMTSISPVEINWLWEWAPTCTQKYFKVQKYQIKAPTNSRLPSAMRINPSTWRKSSKEFTQSFRNSNWILYPICHSRLWFLTFNYLHFFCTNNHSWFNLQIKVGFWILID